MAELTQNQQNPLFGRKEIVLEVNRDEYEPSYANAIKIISEKFSVEKNSFKINKVETTFGKSSFKIYANVYDSPEEKERLEKESKKEQEAVQKIEEEQKQAEQPQETEESSEESGEESSSEESSGEEPKEEGSEGENQEEIKEESSEEKTE